MFSHLLRSGPLRILSITKTNRIMKLTMLLLVAACLQVSARGLAQRVTLSKDNISLDRVFEEIRKQTGINFFYADEALSGATKVSLHVKNEKLELVLDKCLANQPLTYTISDNTIIIKRKPLVPAISQLSASVIEKKEPVLDIFKGKITDDKGQPLEGATIIVKGTTQGTKTGADGTYAINAEPGSILIISYVGYESIEVRAGTVATITLKPVVTTTEQIVVIGYGTQRKRDLTGTITSIKGSDVANMPASNPVSSLQGKVAGLTIVNSGRAGAAPTVRIRGVNSTNNTDPLYVVDGVFQTNVDYLNPADIETIEVLKDPSSIAIFGLQGGNGVIIITTKRAPKGETRVSFQSNVGVQKVINKIDITDGEGFKKLYTAQLANLGAAAFDYTNYTANTNWQDLVLRDAWLNNNTVSVSNSGEKSISLLSLGYNMQEGVLRNDKFEKFVGRINHEIKVNKALRVGGDVTGFYWKRNDAQADITNALWAAPIVPVNYSNNIYYSMPSFQRAQVGNPVARLMNNEGTSVPYGYRAVGSVFAEAKFLKNFTWKSSFYTDLGFNNNRSYSPLPFRYINLGEGGAKTDTSYNTAARTSVSQSQAEYRKYQQDHTLTYDKLFSGGHKVTAMGGFTTLYQGSTSVSGFRRDTLLNIPNDPSYWYMGIVDLNNPLGNGGGGSEESFMSYFGRVSYSFSNRYMLNATLRRDGSSKFAPANRWGTFGSIGAGWVISEENFFNKNHINFLKLRGAWGTVGSGLGLSSNLFLPGLSTANVGVFGDNVYGSVTPAYVPDPNLHWEVVRGVDLGLEWRAFSNRFSGDVTVYDRTTKDILTTLTLPGTAGNYAYRTNLGTITNTGIELNMGWNNTTSFGLVYRLNVNGSYNKNKVESIGNDIAFQILGNGTVNRTVTGESIGYFWGYRQTGIYQTVAELEKRPGFVTSLPGDIAYEDVNKNGVIDADDRTYLGTPFPLYNFGGSLNLAYKGVELMLEGQGVAGNKIYTQRRTYTFATLNYESNRINAWTGPGTTNVEPILDNTRANNFLFSSYFLEPGDYFRLRSVQLAYNLPAATLKRTPFKQFKVFINGQNVATFTKATGYTPEASLSSPIASGADNGTYPVPAVYTAGVNLTF